MSNRGSATAVIIACAVAICAATALAGKPTKDTSKPEPAVSVSKATTKPVSGEVAPPVGAVQRALERLFTIPRPTARPADAADRQSKSFMDPGRLGLQHHDAIRDSASSVPIGGRTLEHRLGMEHADAIQHSTSSVPIGDGSRDQSTDSPVTDKNALVPTNLDTGVTQAAVGAREYYTPGQRVPFNERDWSNYTYYNGQPGRYGHGLNEPVAGDPAGDVYRFGFNNGYYAGRFERTGSERSDRLLARSRGHLERGLQYLHDGRYDAAADAFKLAAETNQGDPAARLYAAHALFATGRYRDAITFLRRAFELQPKVVYLDFDIRDDYGRRADFDQHVEALENALKRAPRNVDRLIVLGYVHYYSNQREKAYEALAKANKVDPKDSLAARLLENCHPPDVVADELETSQK